MPQPDNLPTPGAIETTNLNHDALDQGRINTKTDALIDRLVQPTGWLVLVVVFISVYEVFMRYVLDDPTKWVHETSTFLIAIVFLVGGVRALARNQHVKINLLELLLPVRHRGKLQRVNSFLVIIICAALTYVSAEMAWQSTHARPGLLFYFERTGTFWNPPFPAWIKICLFVSCALMTIQAIAQFIRQLKLRKTSRVDDAQ